MKFQQHKMSQDDSLVYPKWSFMYVFYSLHCFFSFPIGLCVMWAAGFMRKLVILGKFIKFLTGELRAIV